MIMKRIVKKYMRKKVKKEWLITLIMIKKSIQENMRKAERNAW